MVLSAALLLAASVHAAPTALPSFDTAIAQIHASVLAQRAEAATARAAIVGPNLDSYAWDLERFGRDAERLRREQSWIVNRVRRYQPPQAGQPDSDPSLRFEVQRLARDFTSLARDLQWKVNDLRWASSQVQKDPELVRPAQRLAEAARVLKDSAHWLQFDARFAIWDYRRAGFTFEAWDIERGATDMEMRSRDLGTLADDILAKARGT